MTHDYDKHCTCKRCRAERELCFVLRDRIDCETKGCDKPAQEVDKRGGDNGEIVACECKAGHQFINIYKRPDMNTQ